MNNKPTVTIGCPISTRNWILPYYLDHICKIDYPKKLINLYFLINNCKDNSPQILQDFKDKYNDEYNEIYIERFIGNGLAPEDERSDLIRKKTTYRYLATLRNKMIRRTETDYLLSCDSDILVPSNILNKLLNANKDIISGLIYNGYLHCPPEPHKFPNILKLNENGKFIHVSNFYVKNAQNLTESKIAEIDGAGAIILLSKEVCQSTSYAVHDQGEDMAWAIDCRQKGYKLYVDYSAWCNHIMTQKMLDEYLCSKQ